MRSQKPSRATQPLPGVVASTAVRNTTTAGEGAPTGSAGGSGGSAVAVNKSVSAAKADVTSAATVGADNKAQSVVKVSLPEYKGFVICVLFVNSVIIFVFRTTSRWM